MVEVKHRKIQTIVIFTVCAFAGACQHQISAFRIRKCDDAFQLLCMPLGSSPKNKYEGVGPSEPIIRNQNLAEQSEPSPSESPHLKNCIKTTGPQMQMTDDPAGSGPPPAKVFSRNQILRLKFDSDRNIVFTIFL